MAAEFPLFLLSHGQHSGAVTADPNKIVSAFGGFLSALYSAPVNTNTAKLEEFFEHIELPNIEQQYVDRMEAPVTSNKVLLAIKSLKTSKTPGPDGFSGLYYKKFAPILALHLSNLFNALCAETSLSPSSLLADICMIPKPDKDSLLIPNYRPISLINIDVKLLAKVLAARLNTFVADLIHGTKWVFKRVQEGYQQYRHYRKKNVDTAYKKISISIGTQFDPLAPASQPDHFPLPEIALGFSFLMPPSYLGFRYVALLIWMFYVLKSGAVVELIFHIREEQEEGTFIGNVKRSIFSPSAMRFKLLAHTNYFDLDAETGDLYTTSNKLDRELLCPLDIWDQCSMTLDIFTSSQEYSEFSKLKVFILDVNDNAPSFPEQTYTISIPEDTAVGTKFHVDHTAKDVDILDNAALSYRLASPGDVFALDHQSELISLVLLKPLDRESQSEYRMTLTAFDGGLPPLSGTTTFVVRVTDVNDNCPVFLESNITAHLSMEASIGTEVAQLIAVDGDAGENSMLQYHYSYRVPESTRSLFNLDSTTGVITLSGSLEEDTTQYKLSVLAFGFGCRPAMATVTVQLEVKKQEPKMEFRFLGSQQEDGVHIKEDISPGTVIAILDIKDPDESITRPLSITRASPFLLKPSESSPDTFLLLTSTPLDFESKTKYSINIVGNATTNKSVTLMETLTVVVEDVNDNSPKFEQNALEISVEENNIPGDTLLRVSALDKDSGPNGKLSYYFENGESDVFSLNSSNGVVKALVSFDREKQASYSFRIVAKDHGVPSKNDSCLIVINILDQNDNPPEFASKEFTFYIPENLPQGGNVGIINVTDADVGLNGEFSVSLLNDTSLFCFKHDTILRSLGSFDYERQRKYELWVEAIDKGSPPLFSRTKIHVFLLDVNDNAPLIIFPETNYSYVLVSPDTTKGSLVAKVHAVDYDTGMNGVVMYSEYGEISPSTDLFKVDTYSGNITLKESTGNHHCGLYQFLVKASDQGFPEALSTIVRVNILLNHSISNQSYLESFIMKKTPLTQNNQVLFLSPCPEVRQAMAVFDWSLTAPVALAVVSVSVICCVSGTLLFFYSKRKKSKKEPSLDVQVPLQLNANDCAKDCDEVKDCNEVKDCKPSETPLTL
ncbi:protocadherin-20-like [Gastrophryne carolinensis]